MMSSPWAKFIMRITPKTRVIPSAESAVTAAERERVDQVLHYLLDHGATSSVEPR